MKKYLSIYILLIVFVSCKPKVHNEFNPSSGSANFAKYVAVGNSLTAGYANGALYQSGQNNSYPLILSQQFATVGGGSFKQPLMVDDIGFGVDTTPPYFFPKLQLQFKTDCKGVSSLSPVRVGSVNPANFASVASQGPFNNLGVPGAKSFQFLAPQLGLAFPNGNPFYNRFAANPGTSTVIGEAVAQQPTFFTAWIGSNDVLLYAIGGGDQGKDTITGLPTFVGSMNVIINQLTANGAKGAIANVPDITSIPYFTTVPYNGLVLTSSAQVSGLNAAYAPLAAFGNVITFSLGQNPFIIQDASAPGGLRQIKSTEFILLNVPQDSIKCKGWGSTKPIPANYILDNTEIAKVKSATSGYNSTIQSLANSKNLAFVDVNATLSSLKSGLTIDALTFTTTFVTGNAFSLDGIHLTPRGYAVIANDYIEAINKQYGARIPQVDVSIYPGVEFP